MRRLEIIDGNKKCPDCGQLKSLENEYNKNKKTWYGYQAVCRDCEIARNAEYKRRNKKKVDEANLAYRENNHQLIRDNHRKYRENNVEKQLFRGARYRARKSGIPFNIEVEDIVIPERCPVFGVEMKLGHGYDNRFSPSLDKIVPELGYVKGNIQVISRMANLMKQDATQDQLKMFADWVLKTQGES